MKEQACFALIPRGLGKHKLPRTVPFRGSITVYSNYLIHTESILLHTARYSIFFIATSNEQVAGSKIKAQK